MVLTKNHQLRALGSCTAQVGLSCKNSSNYSNVSLAWFAISVKSPAAFFLVVLLKKTQWQKVVRSTTVFGLLKLIPIMVIYSNRIWHWILNTKSITHTTVDMLTNNWLKRCDKLIPELIRLEKKPAQVSQFGVQALFFFHGENWFDKKNTENRINAQ